MSDFFSQANIDVLKTLPELDASEEVSQILEFTLESFRNKYGFQGLGIQLVDYNKKHIRFFKLHIPGVDPESIKKVEQTDIPLKSEGGICYWVVESKWTIYFRDIEENRFAYHLITPYDKLAIDLLHHKSHLIIPVVIEDKVQVLIHFSSFSHVTSVEKAELEEIKRVSTNIGRALFKSLSFKKIYEENQKLMIDILKAQKSRDIFLAGINHELKTPLNAILGFSEYLSKVKKADLAKIRKVAGTIYRNGQSLLSIIREIIDVYSIHSGKINVESHNVYFPDICYQVVESLTPLYQKKDQDIHIQGDRFTLKSDYKRVFQILTNLISNAIKYSDKKGKIKVNCYREEHHAKINIEDNGLGMDKEDLEILFIPFKRGKSAYQKKGEEGSGLGLFISQLLAHILKGDIEVESTPSKGSTFSLILPLL